MSTPGTADAFWDSIDAVMVLNLDHRPERWMQFQQAADGFVPTDKIHRVSAVFGKELAGFGVPPWFRGRKRDATWAARGGCVLAHRRALELARDKGWNEVLILEDDVSFDARFNEVLPALEAALRTSASELCYLGYTDPEGPFSQVGTLGPDHQLARIFGANCTHAYRIRATARDRVLALLPDEAGIWPWLATHRAIDSWYRRELGRHFEVTAVSPAIVHQAEGFSDIAGRDTGHHAQSAHRTSVPDIPASPAYPALYAWKKLTVRLSRVRDGVRGIRKHLAGF